MRGFANERLENAASEGLRRRGELRVLRHFGSLLSLGRNPVGATPKSEVEWSTPYRDDVMTIAYIDVGKRLADAVGGHGLQHGLKLTINIYPERGLGVDQCIAMPAIANCNKCSTKSGTDGGPRHLFRGCVRTGIGQACLANAGWGMTASRCDCGR